MVKFSGDSLIPCRARCLLRFSADSSDHPGVFRIEPISGLAPTDFRHRGGDIDVLIELRYPPTYLRKRLFLHIWCFLFLFSFRSSVKKPRSAWLRVEGRCCHGEDYSIPGSSFSFALIYNFRSSFLFWSFLHFLFFLFRVSLISVSSPPWPHSALEEEFAVTSDITSPRFSHPFSYFTITKAFRSNHGCASTIWEFEWVSHTSSLPHWIPVLLPPTSKDAFRKWRTDDTPWVSLPVELEYLRHWQIHMPWSRLEGQKTSTGRYSNLSKPVVKNDTYVECMYKVFLKLNCKTSSQFAIPRSLVLALLDGWQPGMQIPIPFNPIGRLKR